MEKGILYLAFGQKYRNLVHRSASRVAEFGDWPICVITNENDFPDESLYDEIKVRDPDADWQNTEFGEDIKSTYFPESPYDKTLFLDADTYVVDGSAIEELFEPLEQYDVVATHDTARTGEQGFGFIDDGPPDFPTPTEESPDSFPWLNIGVISFRKSDELSRFFEEWNERFHEQNEIIKGVNDQSSFADVLYESDLTHAVLPPEYNHHVPYPHVHVGPVKIVQGHFDNLPEVGEAVNEDLSEEEPHSLRIIKYRVRKSRGEMLALPIKIPGAANWVE